MVENKNLESNNLRTFSSATNQRRFGEAVIDPASLVLFDGCGMWCDENSAKGEKQGFMKKMNS